MEKRERTSRQRQRGEMGGGGGEREKWVNSLDLSSLKVTIAREKKKKKLLNVISSEFFKPLQ